MPDLNVDHLPEYTSVDKKQFQASFKIRILVSTIWWVSEPFSVVKVFQF